MNIPAPKNGECTFSKTGVCRCKKTPTDSKMANATSAQTSSKLKGVVTKKFT